MRRTFAAAILGEGEETVDAVRHRGHIVLLKQELRHAWEGGKGFTNGSEVHVGKQPKGKYGMGKENQDNPSGRTGTVDVGVAKGLGHDDGVVDRAARQAELEEKVIQQPLLQKNAEAGMEAVGRRQR